MTTFAKSGCLIALVFLGAGCAREPAPPPPQEKLAPPPAVDAGPQTAAGELSDYQIVMNALAGKKVVPADATDEAVDWSVANGLPLQVDKMGCAIEQSVPPHCHMVVNRDQVSGALLPDRKLIIVKMPDGKYSLTIVSAQVPDQAIICFGLRDKGSQTIEGTCGVSGDPGGDPLHNFAATIERLQNRKIRVHFAYRHAPFNSTQEAIHNGDGHATEP
jgi:hypothetical protein